MLFRSVATQDFVEIYNPDQSAIDLSAAGAYIMRDSGCNLGNGVTAIAALTGIINAGSYFTISNDATGYGASANQTNLGNIQDGYCVGILSSPTPPTSVADSDLIDFVAIGPTTDAAYRENASYAPGGANDGQNSRCPNGNDTDVNSNDFSVRPVTQGGTNNCPAAAATALINEVMCVGASGPEDFIELYVTGSGSLAGFKILENGTGTLRYTFGANLAVTAGDYVVLHFDSANQGSFAQEDDASSAIDESTGMDNSATAWDVYVAAAAMGCTDNFIQLQDASSVTVDSVAISNWDGDATALWMTNFATVFGATATYLWTGFSGLPSDGVNDATIQGEAAGDTDLGAVQRDSDYSPLGGGIRDTNTNAEWCIGAYTMGAGNIDCP